MDRGRVVVHIHHVLGIHELNALGQGLNTLLLHQLQKLGHTAHQDHVHLALPGCPQAALEELQRGVVAAHGVNNDLHICYLPVSVWGIAVCSSAARARLAMARFLLALPLTL